MYRLVFDYENSGRVTTVTEYDAYRNLDSIGIDGKSEKLIKYTYRDNNGRLKKITYANGDYMTASYDRLGRMISEKWFNSTGSLTYEYTYAYDGEGNIVKTIDKVNEKEYNYQAKWIFNNKL
ncbi:MAG: hypothetical protein E7613_06805 [Ruminococcaceae bacterium]|nr:hypothetical protein [Oscillospiraceae bacterium]